MADKPRLIDGNAMRNTIDRALAENAPKPYRVFHMRMDTHIAIGCACTQQVLVMHDPMQGVRCPACGTHYRVSRIDYDIRELLKQSQETGQPPQLQNARAQIEIAADAPRVVQAPTLQ